MKFNLKNKSILEKTFLILLFAILIGCDSVGDSNNGQTGNMPSMETDPTLIPPEAPPNDPGQPQKPTNSPTPLPAPSEPLDDFQSTVLSLVNQARAQSRNCGGTRFSAAPAVTWDNRIENAAIVHSEDMAQNQNFSHTGTDGSNAGDRLLMQGYNWSTWGENILAGLDDASDVIDAWLGSSGHCSIIMNSALKQVGAGVVEGTFQGRIESYWTLVFATEN